MTLPMTRYKAIVCDKDEYLLSLVRYIHLNPVRAKMVRRIEEYPYSGHRNYAEGRVSEALEPQTVLDMVGGRARYRRFVQEGFKEGDREEHYRVEDQRFLGAEGLGEKLKRKAKEEELPRPKKQLSVVFRSAAGGVGVEPDVLGGADRGWKVFRARALVVYVLTRRQGYRLKAVARYMGRDVATVSSLVSRFSQRMATDEELKKQTDRIAKIV